MTDTMLTARDWIRVFDKTADAIEASRDRLNELDGVIGDGDHGVTMCIGFRAVRQALANLAGEATVDQVFAVAGRHFLSAAGGAIGPIIGTMWTDTGKAFPGCTAFTGADCRRMFEIMENAVVRRGKASLGDKTLLDALHPAVEAVRQADGIGIDALLGCAADAALSGARSTSRMIARMGRSSRLGERTLGYEDAGANSMAIMLRAMAEAVRTA